MSNERRMEPVLQDKALSKFNIIKFNDSRYIPTSSSLK